MNQVYFTFSGHLFDGKEIAVIFFFSF